MSQLIGIAASAVYAAPVLAGRGMALVLMGVIAAGILTSIGLLSRARHTRTELPPPITRPRLIDPEDEDTYVEPPHPDRPSRDDRGAPK